MRRVASVLVIAAVAAVAIVAAVDAVGRDPEPERSARSLRLYFPDARTVLRGRLVWIDQRCRLHVTDVATLQKLEEPRRVSCRAGLDSGGRLVRRATGRVSLIRDGQPVRPPVARPRALVLSPDRRWALAAGGRSLYLFRPGDPELRFRRLPIVATDLAWVSSGA